MIMSCKVILCLIFLKVLSEILTYTMINNKRRVRSIFPFCPVHALLTALRRRNLPMLIIFYCFHMAYNNILVGMANYAKDILFQYTYKLYTGHYYYIV